MNIPEECFSCPKSVLLNNTDPADVCDGCDIFEEEFPIEEDTVVEEKDEDDWDYTDDLDAFLGGW